MTGHHVFRGHSLQPRLWNNREMTQQVANEEHQQPATEQLPGWMIQKRPQAATPSDEMDRRACYCAAERETAEEQEVEHGLSSDEREWPWLVNTEKTKRRKNGTERGGTKMPSANK